MGIESQGFLTRDGKRRDRYIVEAGRKTMPLNLRLMIVFLSLLMLVVFQEKGFPEVYKFKDENGNWKFTDTPPAYDSENMEVLEGTVSRKPEGRDVREELYKSYPPRNKIEEATLAAVKITSTIGTGSGFFISNNGYILTNRHVILGDERQAKMAEDAFATVKSKIDYADKQFALAEKRLEQDIEYLEQIKIDIDSLPDKSSRREYMENRYQIEMEEYDARKERYEAEKLKYEAWKKNYKNQRSEYDFQTDMDAISRQFTITLKNGAELDARLVRTSQDMDLALLKVDGYKTPAIEPGGSSNMAQGRPVYAIGSPLNLSDSVTRGIVSGYRDGYIQTDAKIYPGNSGGPLITEDGRIIGINTMKELTRGFEGLGFAIPIQVAIDEFKDELNR
jgi:serine protease Do